MKSFIAILGLTLAFVLFAQAKPQIKFGADEDYQIKFDADQDYESRDSVEMGYLHRPHHPLSHLNWRPVKDENNHRQVQCRHFGYVLERDCDMHYPLTDFTHMKHVSYCYEAKHEYTSLHCDYNIYPNGR